MKTKLDCLNLFLNYLDEYSKKGVELAITKNADYRAKFNHFLNEAQVYIAGLIKIPAVMTVTQFPIPNLLGGLQNYDMRQYLPGENKVFTATGGKSYYFEMDNIGTVEIAINGVLSKTITNTSKRQFTAYKGNTGANSTDIVTITFTGAFPYIYKNTAMYAYAFPTDEDVLDYAITIEYPMPSDFMSFDSVTIKSDPMMYEKYIGYKWENNKKVILRSNEKGSFDIHYFKYPVTIIPTAPDDTPLEVEDKAVDLVVLQAAIKATASDNQNLSSWLMSLYIEKVQNVVGQDMPSSASIQTIYSM